MKKLIILPFVYLLSSCASTSQTVIPLYDKVPNSKPSEDKETSSNTGGIFRISNVSVPEMTMYQPSNLKLSAAVIICPGGGYGILAATHEGSDVAKAFNEWGITAFVLKYRLPNDAIMIDKTIGPLQDAQRAIQLVRQNAKQWNIDPNKIGIMGFSAGGHLASTASTHFKKPVIDNPDKISLRPDFSILIYPVISFNDSLTHKGSRNNLLGQNPAPEKIKEFSNELQVTAETPKAFLVHAKDDGGVTVDNSIQYYEALKKNKVSAELKLYEQGGHGFGMNNKTTDDSWMEHLKEWMKKNNLL